MQLQELETQKWAAAGRTDRGEGWNSYVDAELPYLTKSSVQVAGNNFLIFLHILLQTCT